MHQYGASFGHFAVMVFSNGSNSLKEMLVKFRKVGGLRPNLEVPTAAVEDYSYHDFKTQLKTELLSIWYWSFHPDEV